MTAGLCPFAEQIPGVTSQNPGSETAGFDRVGFCDHTAGGYMGTLRDPRFWNGAGVSNHFAIGLDGSIVQIVNIFETAWGQGRLGPVQTWAPYSQMKVATGTGNPNAWLISTEHEDQRVTNLVWPEAMYQSDLKVKRWCVEECKAHGYDVLKYGIDSLAGHHMFDGVNRPYCPGTNWPRQRLFQDLTSEAGGTPVTPDDEVELTLFRTDRKWEKAKADGRYIWVPTNDPNVIELKKIENGSAVAFPTPYLVDV